MDRLKVGDLVQVISGKHRGSQGRVTRLLKEDERVVIEGVNMVTRHQRPTPRQPEGGRIQKEAPLHASRVMPVDPSTGKPTRVQIRTGEDGKKVRTAKSGAPIVSG